MENKLQEWLHKVQSTEDEMDLSSNEDLGIALMHLISLEEHFYFTAMKTDKKEYLKMLDEVRSIRKGLLRKIVKNPEGEEWCISKHLLGGSMRLIETGTKELSRNKDSDSYFQAAFDLFSLFFIINSESGISDSQKTSFMESNSDEEEFGHASSDLFTGESSVAASPGIEEEKSTASSFMKKAREVLKKLVDCCRE